MKHLGGYRRLWLCTLSLCLLLSALAAIHQARSNDALIGHELGRLAETVSDRVQARVALYEYGLRGLRGVFVASDRLTLDEFEHYSQSRDLAREFPGSRGFGILMRVRPGEEAAFTASAIRDGLKDFRIHSLAPHDGERIVIKYLEATGHNARAIGFDIASEPRRLEAARQAIRSARSTLTAPVTLVQEPALTRRAFLVMLPIYRPGAPATTPAERDAAAMALACAPLIIDEVLAPVLEEDAGLYTLSLRDRAEGNAPPFFGSLEPEHPLPVRKVRIPVFGREWDAEVRATPAFIAQLRLTSAPAVLGAGILLSLILATLAHSFATARQRKDQIRLEQARRAAITEGSADAIIGISQDGRVTDWNRAAAQMFGIPEAAALGQDMTTLLPPAPGEALAARLRQVMAGERVAAYETRRPGADGQVVDVSVSLSPLPGRHGACVSMTMHDISGSRRAREALSALNDSLEAQISERTALLDSAHRTLRTLMDSVPSMIGYWDRDLINRAANDAYRRIFINGSEAPEGRPMQELLDPALCEQNRPCIEAALRGEAQVFEREVSMAGSGERRHVQVHFIPDIADGTVRGFHTLAHDITDLVRSRSRLASALRENAALLQTINDQTIVSVTDSHGLITDVNDSFCRISGYTRGELIGHSHAVVNSGVHDPEFWSGMWQTVTSGRSWRREVCNRRKDGALYWVDSIIAPFRGDDGRIEKYISIRTDITARKAIESTLARTSTLLGGVLDAASEVSIVASDPNGLITVFNSGAERMLGYTAAEMVGRQTPAIFHPEEEVQERARELALATGREMSGFDVFIWNAGREGSETRDWTYVRKDGSRFPVSLTVTCIRNEALEIQGYLGIAHDISQHQEYARSLRDAMLREKRANLAKSQFLANMSHEIRTPMNAVVGLSFLLGQTRLDAGQADLLGKLQVAGKSLLAIINDILDLSKIEAGELVIERAPFRLGEAIRETMQLFENPAREKRIHLDLDNPVDEGLVLEGDVTRLRQILVNLVSNAIKFTEQGEVQMRVSVLARQASSMRLRFEVSDSGIGIAAEALPRLFEPFSQEDASTTRRFGGTGLGLSIVRQLVSLMHGQLGVESEPGRGSRFWFELAFPISSAPLEDPGSEPANALSAGLAGVHLLVVDDSEINRMVARRILELAGARVDTACNGREALDLLAGGLQTDLVLMDIHMPVMDGFDATLAIRGRLGMKTLPIIALSAGTMEANRAQALECGMNDFVGKPFNADRLVASIRQHLISPPPLTTTGPASAPSPVNATADDWPLIEGLDASESRGRFAGDAGLFLRMLGKLLEEFADLGPAAIADDTLAHRLHTLKGNAGTLGAQTLADSARGAERAATAKDHDTLARELGLIRQQLDALEQAARPCLQAPVITPASVPSGETPRSDEGFDALIVMLREADLGALACHAALAPDLQRRLGAETAARLEACVTSLQFDEALTLLGSH